MSPWFSGRYSGPIYQSLKLLGKMLTSSAGFSLPSILEDKDASKGGHCQEMENANQLSEVGSQRREPASSVRGRYSVDAVAGYLTVPTLPFLFACCDPVLLLKPWSSSVIRHR